MDKVLIVDDDPEILDLYGMILKRAGLEVLEAHSGQEALAKIKAELPALVLLDVMMPEMDGYEVCRLLRQNPQTAQLPILMVSARATIVDRRNGMLAGANDFLTKTMDPRRLVTRILTFLSHPLAGDVVTPVHVSNV